MTEDGRQRGEKKAMKLDEIIVKMAKNGSSAADIITVTGLTTEQLKQKSVDLWFLYIQQKEILQTLARIFGECVDAQS